MPIVSSGQTKNVSANTSSFNDEILSGGVEYVGKFNSFYGGSAVSANVNGGEIHFEGGGFGSVAVIHNGGIAYVDNGGILNNSIVSGGGVISAFYNELDSVSPKGSASAGSAHLSGISVGPGGTLYTLSGATASNTTIATGGIEYVGAPGSSLGGTEISATINGGKLFVQSGGDVKGATINSGGSAVVGQSGTLSGAVVSSGATVAAESGGIVRASTALSGGTFLVSGPHAQVNESVVSSGAVISVTDNGSATNTRLDGGTLFIENYGVIGGTQFNGGTLIAGSGGELHAITLPSGLKTIVQSSGTIHDVFVSGGSLQIEGGSIVTSTGFTGAGQVDLESGAIWDGLNSSAYGVTQSGATMDVHSAATVRNMVVTSSGTLNLDSGAILTGSATVSDHGTMNGAHILSGSVVQVGSNGHITETTISSGGQASLASGGVSSDTTVLSGGTFTVAKNGVLSGLTTVSSGATMVLNGDAGNGAIHLAGDGAQITISGTQMPTNVISGFTTNDRIDLNAIPKSSIKSISRENNQIQVTTSNGTQYVLNAPGANNYGYQLLDDGNDGTIYTTCFAEGTLIATPEGDVAVEALAPGREVLTPKGAMPVKWLGHRAITVATQRVPEENWLIRIRADALADGVPARDLLVTQEHCMVFDGKLVPARMLVNDASILIDRSIPAYTYYHVELETHEAIWAEGALTESYLDTGNRDQFDNNPVTAAFPARLAGGSDSLPLDTSRSFVEPIHAAIAARCGAITAPVATTQDADLHLVTETGAIVSSHRTENGHHMFMLPKGVERVVLASRTSRPSDVIGPFVDDRRNLGVLVGEIIVFGADGLNRLDAHLATADLPGWDVQEASPCRWTNGAATLPVGRDQTGDPRVLAVQVLAAGPYRIAEKAALLQNLG